MLEVDVVHGDLSAFNVLWWRERPVIIDLSQAVDAVTHPAARDLLARDVERTASYFERMGVTIDRRAALALVGDSPVRFARHPPDRHELFEFVRRVFISLLAASSCR